jgi:hypothetical protein
LAVTRRAKGRPERPLYAGLLSATLAYAERVRIQFLSLRQLLS